METIILSFMITGLFTVFAVDTLQKRRRFLREGKCDLTHKMAAPGSIKWPLFSLS